MKTILNEREFKSLIKRMVMESIAEEEGYSNGAEDYVEGGSPKKEKGGDIDKDLWRSFSNDARRTLKKIGVNFDEISASNGAAARQEAVEKIFAMYPDDKENRCACLMALALCFIKSRANGGNVNDRTEVFLDMYGEARKVIDKYDPSTGNALSTFLGHYLTGANREFYANKSSIKIPQEIQSYIKRMKEIQDSYMKEHGRSISDTELYDIISPEIKGYEQNKPAKFRIAMDYMQQMGELDAPLGSEEGDGGSYGDKIGGGEEKNWQTRSTMEQDEINKGVVKLLDNAGLSDFERKAFCISCGLLGAEEKFDEEGKPVEGADLARLYGLDPAKYRKAVKIAQDKLRNANPKFLKQLQELISENKKRNYIKKLVLEVLKRK